jgi:hypothetical protein
MAKTFCPSCGNATLLRTAVSVNADGTLRYHLRSNFQYRLRGTKVRVAYVRCMCCMCVYMYVCVCVYVCIYVSVCVAPMLSLRGAWRVCAWCLRGTKGHRVCVRVRVCVCVPRLCV